MVCEIVPAKLLHRGQSARGHTSKGCNSVVAMGTRRTPADENSHFDADLLRARLDHRLDLIQLLLAELLQIPRVLVQRRALVHGRLQQERAVLDLDRQVKFRLDILDGLLQLALPDVAPWANLNRPDRARR